RPLWERRQPRRPGSMCSLLSSFAWPRFSPFCCICRYVACPIRLQFLEDAIERGVERRSLRSAQGLLDVALGTHPCRLGAFESCTATCRQVQASEIGRAHV